MTRDDIIRMAREAGLGKYHLQKYHLQDSTMEYEFDRCLERFFVAAYAAGAAAERKEAAIRAQWRWLREQHDDDGGAGETRGPRFAEIIRARGEKE